MKTGLTVSQEKLPVPKDYTSPVLEEHGNLVNLTQGKGGSLDDGPSVPATYDGY